MPAEASARLGGFHPANSCFVAPGSRNPGRDKSFPRHPARALCRNGATSLHLAPTDLAARFLRAEGVAEERIAVVGNPVIDVLRRLGVPRRPPAERDGIVLTAHRPTNVDDPERLERLIELAVRLAAEIAPVTFPVHPRTARRLADAHAEGRLEAGGVRLLPPLPYPEMLARIAGARLIVTDSGGLQEEASWFGVPVVVLRSSTPRWEGVEAGTSVLAGLDADRAVEAGKQLSTPEEQRRVAAVPCPYGDGHTAERVAVLLADPGTVRLLTLEERSLRQGGFAARPLRSAPGGLPDSSRRSWSPRR